MTEDENTEDVREIRLVKSDHDKMLDAVAILVWAGCIYLWTSPTSRDKLVDYTRVRWARFKHLVSIWQTQRSIETLPETDDPEL